MSHTVSWYIKEVGAARHATTCRAIQPSPVFSRFSQERNPGLFHQNLQVLLEQVRTSYISAGSFPNNPPTRLQVPRLVVVLETLLDVMVPLVTVLLVLLVLLLLVLLLWVLLVVVLVLGCT